MRKYFGTDGIRGRANQAPLTPEIITQLAQAIGTEFVTGNHIHRVVIGKDTRLSGYMVEYALASGFVSVGMNVDLLGPMPTPAVSMLTRSLRADLGIMISASHNPYEDNGIKIFGPDGCKLSDDKERAIEARLGTPPPLAASDRIGKMLTIEDAVGRYIEFLKGGLDRSMRFDGFKVVLDCAHGAAYKIAPTIFYELGASTVVMGARPNGRNINEERGATSTAELQKRVLEVGAHLGIAYDGDADRVVFVDEKGQKIDGDQILALLGREWQKQGHLKGDGVVATVMSNMGLETYLGTFGLKLHRSAVGDRYVSEMMAQTGCNIGGEQSGHVILSDFSTAGDGIATSLQILSALVKAGCPASEFLHAFTPCPQVLINVPMDKTMLDREDVQQTLQDMEASFDGRLLIRPSGTEPLVRVMGEGKDEAQVRAFSESVADYLRAV